jgi:aquaporin Z
MNMSTKMYIAEFIGTFALVLIGCGSIAIGGLGGALGADKLGAVALLPIAMAFGMTVTAMAYGIGPVSGCHVNPAVSIGVWAAGRIDTMTLVGYIIAQCAGAIVAALVLMTFLGGNSSGLGVTTVGEGFSQFGGVAMEAVATFIFLVVILGATQKNGSTPVAGLAIGMALVVIHLCFIKATGSSVNPARSLGPALFVGGKALADLWVYFVGPIIGALVAGVLYRTQILEA